MTHDLSPGTERWRYETGAAVRAGATVYDGTVFVGSLDGTVYAINAESGDERWSVTTGGSIRAAPTVFGSVVYVGSGDGNVYELDRETGVERWRYETAAPIDGSPAVFDLVLYVANREGRVCAVDLSRREQVWRTETAGGVRSAPLVVDDTIYVSATDGTLHALDIGDGTERWTFDADDEFHTAPTVAERTVYIGDQSGTMYAVDATTGEGVGQLGDDSSPNGLGDYTAVTTPTTVGSTIFFGHYFGRTYAARIEPTRQGTLWRAEGVIAIQSSPTVADDRLYVGDTGRVSAFERDSGDCAWDFQPGDAEQFQSPPTVRNGTLYIGNDNGSLYAIATRGGVSSNGNRVILGTHGHHDRHAIFQTATGMNLHVRTDDDSIERTKRLNSKLADLLPDE